MLYYLLALEKMVSVAHCAVTPHTAESYNMGQDELLVALSVLFNRTDCTHFPSLPIHPSVHYIPALFLINHCMYLFCYKSLDKQH